MSNHTRSLTHINVSGRYLSSRTELTHKKLPHLLLLQWLKTNRMWTKVKWRRQSICLKRWRLTRTLSETPANLAMSGLATQRDDPRSKRANSGGAPPSATCFRAALYKLKENWNWNKRHAQVIWVWSLKNQKKIPSLPGFLESLRRWTIFPCPAYHTPLD